MHVQQPASQDGGLVGQHVDTVTFNVEHGKISEFVKACRLTDAVHLDPQVAASRGMADIPATATHVVVAGHQREPRSILAELGIDFSRVVVGGGSWDYLRPVVAGDRLTGHRTVSADVRRRSKQGHQLRIVELSTEFTDEAGDVVIRQYETLIERTPGDSHA